ncbi:MAG: PilZ domain-containing protein, partial [Acidobacteriota bacterium]
MLLHLEPPLRRTRTAGHVLAVEPNSVRASLLRDLLREHVRVHLEVVPDVECAIRSIAERVPDLVITSTFLSPSDEAALVADLRARPGASHVQVIIVPHFTSQDGATGDPPRGFRLLRRTSPAVTGFDLTALRNQILEYLEQARDATRLAEDMAAWRQSAIALADEPLVTKPELRLVHRAEDPRTDAAATTLIRRFARAMEDGHDRRGARRLSSAELPWLWSARLSSGAELKLVDLSNTGVLVETAAKLTLGTTVDLRLVGQDTDLLVPAHVLRSTVSEVN